jgi:FMN phosphatase YigB (HAD superfamily)
MNEIVAIITDFSRVLLFPTDNNYAGSLNELNNRLMKDDPDYTFLDYFSLNKELLAFYRELQTELPVFIFTSDSIQEHPAIKEGLAQTFRGVFSAKELNVSKDEAWSYTKLAKQLHIKTGEMLYIDDQQKNVNAAKDAGCKTILYRDNDTLIAEVKSYLI